jgi:hypothetical protein
MDNSKDIGKTNSDDFKDTIHINTDEFKAYIQKNPNVMALFSVSRFGHNHDIFCSVLFTSDEFGNYVYNHNIPHYECDLVNGDHRVLRHCISPSSTVKKNKTNNAILPNYIF